jgi:hypothetical protein
MDIKVSELNLTISNEVLIDPPRWFTNDLVFDFPISVKAGTIVLVKDYDNDTLVVVWLWKSREPSITEERVGEVYFSYNEEKDPKLRSASNLLEEYKESPEMHTCWACKGNTKCLLCQGTRRTTSKIDGRSIPCPLCEATGICNVCEGSGMTSASSPDEELAKSGISYEDLEKAAAQLPARSSIINSTKNSSESGGCFIATAVYDSIAAPEVVFLQGFRDKVLLKNSIGRIFVYVYYRISPPIANIISRHSILKPFVKAFCIQPIVDSIKMISRRK